MEMKRLAQRMWKISQAWYFLMKNGEKFEDVCIIQGRTSNWTEIYLIIAGLHTIAYLTLFIKGVATGTSYTKHLSPGSPYT